MENIKHISNKNRTYYFFNDMTNIKNLGSKLLKINKMSYRNIDIYYIWYITIKNIGNYENTHSVNPLYLIASKADAYIEESNGDKYLVFASTDKKQRSIDKVRRILGWD